MFFRPLDCSNFSNTQFAFWKPPYVFAVGERFKALPHGQLGSDVGELDLGLNPLRQLKTEAPEQGVATKFLVSSSEMRDMRGGSLPCLHSVPAV